MEKPDFEAQSKIIYPTERRQKAFQEGCEHVWNTHVVPLLQKIKEQDEFIEEGLDRNDRFDRAEKQWYDLHLKDQAEIKALQEEIESLKDQILEQGELDGN